MCAVALVRTLLLYVGRCATRVAKLLMGRHKVDREPHEDVGDYVVVVNAAHSVMTGRKMTEKKYRWHTGYVGGLKETTPEQMAFKDPTRHVRKAVLGMMPKTRLRPKYMSRLKVYPFETHPHEAQVAGYAPAVVRSSLACCCMPLCGTLALLETGA